MPNLVKTGSSAVSLLPTGFIPKLLNTGFFIAIASGAYLVLKKLIGSFQKNAAMKDYGQMTTEGIATTFATQLYTAMFSSLEWFSDWFGDGTNEEVIMKTGADMFRFNVPFAIVATRYRALYQRDLLHDLQKELSSAELEQFNTALTTGFTGLSGPSGSGEPTKILMTTSCGFVMNEKFEPIQAVQARTKLGKHLETYILPGNRVIHGFSYQGKMRYVESKISNLYPDVSS